MSAFYVGSDLIDLLVTVAVEGAPHSRGLRVVHNGALHVFDVTDADMIGQLLTDANVASVNYRYNDGENPAPYKYRRVADVGGLAASYFDVLKGCDCFDYQSCELPNYDASMAADVVRAIRSKVIERITPDSASWCWSRATAAARLDAVRADMNGGK